MSLSSTVRTPAAIVLQKLIMGLIISFYVFGVQGASLQQIADDAVDDLVAASTAGVQQAAQAGIHWQIFQSIVAICQGFYRILLLSLSLLRLACQPLIYVASLLYTIMRPGVLILQLAYRVIIGIPLSTIAALGRTLYPAYLYLTTAAFIGLLCGIILAVTSQLLLILLPSSRGSAKKRRLTAGRIPSAGSTTLAPDETPVSSLRTGRGGYFDRSARQSRATTP